MTNTDIHLSIVATSRNDNHGGSLTYRTQHFVDGFVKQCIRHDLRAELILVEWNPPAERGPLRDSLRFPDKKGPCDIRVITVPAHIHEKMKCARELPLFQMIAKNVGIRRARGKFVLATNIDILFSDEIMCYLRDHLRTGVLYRADRFDVPTELRSTDDFDELLSFCRQSAFRVHRRDGSFVRKDGVWRRERSQSRLLGGLTSWLRALVTMPSRRAGRLRSKLARVAADLRRGARKWLARAPSVSSVNWISQGVRWLLEPFSRIMRSRWVVSKLKVPVRVWHWFGWQWHEYMELLRTGRLPHTNACGDFTLLSREDWQRLAGYPEWEIFSWHLDSILLYQARYCGFREIDLPGRMAVYHIEHGTGSGYTPEGAAALFSRLDRAGIPYLSLDDFLRIVSDMKAQRDTARKPAFNDDNWGLTQVALPEQLL